MLYLHTEQVQALRLTALREALAALLVAGLLWICSNIAVLFVAITHKISLYMKVKYIIVNIVNRNVKMEVVSRDTYIPYMKVKHINVDIVNLKQQYNIV